MNAQTTTDRMASQPKATLDIEAEVWVNRINAPGIDDKMPWIKLLYPEMIPQLRSHGHMLRPELDEAKVIHNPKDYRVGFVVHSAVIVPDTQWLIDFLKTKLPFTTFVFVLSPAAPEITAALAGVAKVTCVQAPTPMKKLLDLRNYVEIDQLSAMVWVGSPLWLTTAAAIPVAPKVFWAHSDAEGNSGLNICDLELSTADDVAGAINRVLTPMEPISDEAVQKFVKDAKARRAKRKKPKPVRRPVRRPAKKAVAKKKPVAKKAKPKKAANRSRPRRS